MTTVIRKMPVRLSKMWIAVFAGGMMMQGTLSAQTGVVYQDDFTERTSEDAADGWHSKSYVYPANLCYRFNYSSSITRKTPYTDTTKIQDGWFKSFGTATAMGQNATYGMYAEIQTNRVDEYRTENDATNPFLALWSTGGYAVTNEMMVVHPLGNVFTSGVLRISVDMRAPSVWHGRAFFMVRPMFAKAMEAEIPQPDLYPMEFGLWNWTSEGQNSYKSSNGNQIRPIVNGGVEGAEMPTKLRSDMLTWNLASNLWNRCVVTLDLDASTWQAYRYSMGTTQPLPTAETPASGTTLKNNSGSFYRGISDETGPIAGIAFHAYHINRTYYNSNTYYQDNAARADNVKVEWKAPGSSEFVSCYENDFAQRRYRAVSPAAVASGVYAPGESVAANVFSGYTVNPNKDTVNAQYFTQTVPSGGSSASSYLGDPGIDGWRRLNAINASAYGSIHNWGGDGGAVMRVESTKNSAQSALFVNRFANGLSSGKVRLSVDVRLPESWLMSTRNISVMLGSSALYSAVDDSSTSAAVLARAGIGNAAGTGFNPSWLTGSGWATDSSATLTASEWYRVVVTADLALRTYDYSIYSMGADTVAASAVPAGAALCEQNGIAFSGTGTDIGALGIETTSVGYSIAAATLFDNVKVEKSGDGIAWTTVYENDFATRTAYEVAGAESALASMALGVPEMDLDGWVRRGVGFGEAKVSGSANPAAAFSTGKNSTTGDDSACAVKALGTSVKGGIYTVSVDVRPPAYWSLTNGFAHVILGGDEFYQGELGTQTVGENSLRNFEEAAALRFGIGHNTGSSAMLGVFRETDVCAIENGVTVWNGTNLDRSASRWYRFKAKVDIPKGTWSLSVFDMGVSHPTAGSNGALLGKRDGLTLGTISSEGITAIGLKVKGVPAGIRYYEDSDGGILFDNITIKQIPGLVVSFR